MKMFTSPIRLLVFALFFCSATTVAYAQTGDNNPVGQASIDQPQVRINPSPVPIRQGAFSLIAGQSVQSQLYAWAKRAGWTVVWKMPDAWVVPGNKMYGDNFEIAVAQVIEDLAANGADIVGDSWRANQTIVITQNGAAAQ